MKKEIFDFSEALRRMKEGKKVRRVIWDECGAYISILSLRLLWLYAMGNSFLVFSKILRIYLQQTGRRCKR